MSKHVHDWMGMAGVGACRTKGCNATYPPRQDKPKRNASPLPRAVRELLRDVVLRRAWYAGAINDCPASSEEMADRAAKLLGTTREDVVRRAKAKR